MTNRIKSGVLGLDELIGGGFIEGDSILISGAPGTGKSILGMQYLYYGALECDDPGIYVSFEETTDRIKSHFRVFNWDIDRFDQESKISVMSLDPIHSTQSIHHTRQIEEYMFNFRTVQTVIEHAVETMNAKRIVIDSLSALTSFAKSTFEVREVILYLKELLSSYNCTPLFLSQSQKAGTSHILYEETLVDGIIYLYYEKKDLKRQRSIEIIKMRDTSHYEGIYSLKITKAGIEVYPFKAEF